MAGIPAWVVSMRDIGIAGKDFAARRRIRTINIVALLAAIVTFGYCIFYVAYDFGHFRNEIIVLAVMSSLYPVVHMLTGGNRPDAAMWALAGIGLTHLTLISRMLGTGAGSHYYLLVLPYIMTLLTGEDDRVSVWPYAVAAGLAISVIALGDYPGSFSSMPESFRLTLLLVNIFGSVMLASGVAVFFRWLIHRAETKLENERARSDRLLHAILPDPIAARLRIDETDTVAERFADATVVFADIVGFTRRSTQIEPDLVVAELNRIFGGLDELAQARGVEKIKTIGDAYFAVCGLPEPAGNHADRIADFALDLEKFATEWRSDVWPVLRFRVAINTGPVVAGVIGRSKFAYDVWGDTVNTAARLEEKCSPGSIVVAPQTRARLSSRFSLSDIGKLKLRDKGEMNVYRLNGRRKPGSISPE